MVAERLHHRLGVLPCLLGGGDVADEAADLGDRVRMLVLDVLEGTGRPSLADRLRWEVVRRVLRELGEGRVDVGHLRMALDDAAAAIVEQRERADESEVSADVFLGERLVDAAVEPVVLGHLLQLATEDTTLAVLVGVVRVHAIGRPGEQPWHRPGEDRDVGGRDRVAGDADVGRPTVAARGRGVRTGVACAGAAARASSGAVDAARATRSARSRAGSGRGARGAGGAPASRTSSAARERFFDLHLAGAGAARREEHKRETEREDSLASRSSMPPLNSKTSSPHR